MHSLLHACTSDGFRNNALPACNRGKSFHQIWDRCGKQVISLGVQSQMQFVMSCAFAVTGEQVVGSLAIVYALGPGLNFSSSCSRHDTDPVCHQERLPQQAPQHADRPQHQLLLVIVDADDDDLALLLHGPGKRAAVAATRYAPQGVCTLSAADDLAS